MTKNPGPDTRSSCLHPRLTVARASVSERAELCDGVEGLAVSAADLGRAAQDVALERSAQRAAARARLDAAAARVAYDLQTATTQLDQLYASRQALLEGAQWALDVEAALPAHAEVVDAARGVLEARQADQRAARLGLDRVIEQRFATDAAIEDADHQLDELVGIGMDESGLRRELEASGQAVRAAHDAHATAVTRLQELLGERDVLEQRCSSLREALAARGPGGVRDDKDFDQVVAAFDEWVHACELVSYDPYAHQLADAFTDLLADLAELERQAGPRPDEHALERAHELADRAARELERLTVADTPALTPAERAALDAARNAVQEAEERSDRRVGRVAARKRLDAARAAERGLLDGFGFGSHLDVVLTGGRAIICAPERLAAERTFLAAKAARDRLLKAQRASPELEHIHSERARLLALAADRLGVDPGDDVVALLRAHPLVSDQVLENLRAALARVGVHPVGVALSQAAQEWLRDEVATAEDRRRARAATGQVAAELEALVVRSSGLADEIIAARQAEEGAAEGLELASRSVGAVEAELSVRAGGDGTRPQRFFAAEQLRTQVAALAATLRRAEDDARALFDRAGEAALVAEVALDRAQGALADLVRRARKLAEELPIDRHLAGDPLVSLGTLAGLLRDHAAVCQPAIDAAEAAVAVTTGRFDTAVAIAEAAGTGGEGPRPEDVEEAMGRLLEANGGGLVLLDDPFQGLAVSLRSELLEVVLGRTGAGSLVLLTEDTDVLGWAIELPADQAAVVPADSLLNLSAAQADINSDPVTSTRLRVG